MPRSVFTAIDFETADQGRDSACAVAAVVVADDVIVDRYSTLIRPPRERILFTHIHGLAWDDVRDAPDFAGIWPVLRKYLVCSDFLVAHNAPFDRAVLLACCAAAGESSPRKRFACTVDAARRTWRLPRNRLPDVCRHLGIALNHHDALSDAEACARIAIAARREGTEL
ncbi:MAG: exonuclease domain-containing protein [Alphaproteobacteria bacterium]